MSVNRYSELYDMPLLNWEKCLEGKFHFIREKRADGYNNEDIKAFYRLYNKYIKKYGLGKEYRAYLEYQENYILLCAAYVETGKERILNDIATTHAKMEQMKPSSEKGVSIGQVVSMLSKWQGHWISKKEITVEEYKDLLGEYERENK